MNKSELGSKLIEKIAQSEIVESDSAKAPSEIWISPQHWKAMSDEKKAIVVDLWHSKNSYSNVFPFDNMNKPVNTYSVGITFSIPESEGKENKVITSIVDETVKEFKIPHLRLTWNEVEAKRKNYLKK